MRGKLFVVVALLLAVSLVAAAPAGAKAPLRGDIALDYNVGAVIGEGCAPGIAWFGTIEIGDTTYGMVFDDGPMWPAGKAEKVWHWIEDWRIYESVDYELVNNIVVECSFGTLLLEGTVKGIMTPQGGGPANGYVTGAYDDFAEWDGRPVHMYGAVTAVIDEGPFADWGLPAASEMTLQIN